MPAITLIVAENYWSMSEWVEFNAPLDTIQVISEAEILVYDHNFNFKMYTYFLNSKI